MTIDVDDLFCAGCGGYVHLFLDRCPACGAAHPSRYDEVLANPGGSRLALTDDPSVRHAADEIDRKYTHLSGRRGSFSFGDAGDEGDEIDLGRILQRIVTSLTYRAFGGSADTRSGTHAAVAVTTDELQLREAPRGRVLASVRPALVLSAACPSSERRAADGWAGIVFGGLRALPASTVPGGDLLVTYAADRSYAQFSIGNRPGLFASKTRADHYRTVAHWLGLLAGSAARARWSEIGPRAYAAELGLVTGAGPSDAAGKAIAEVPPASTAAPRPSVRDALFELEGLHSAGLVTDAEFEEKRREILKRL